MSASPPKADIAEDGCHLRLLPQADSCTAASSTTMFISKNRVDTNPARAFARPVGYCALQTQRQQFILQCFRLQRYSHKMSREREVERGRSRHPTIQNPLSSPCSASEGILG